MKEIKLTKGKVAQVDNENFDYLNKFKWYALKSRTNFYAARHFKYINKKQTQIKMHREILGLTDSKIFCDHIDRNGLNNQRSNLRIATNAQNMYNRSSFKNSSSKYLGVSLLTSKNKNNPKIYIYWKARITQDCKIIYLGLFKSETDAALAYNEAAIKLHGEFANLNII